MTEVETLRVAEGSGHTPRCIEYDVQEQGEDMPCPHGYLYIVVMSFVPGEPAHVLQRGGELSQQDKEIMRLQVIHTWE